VTGRVGAFETGDVGGQAKTRTAASGSEETGVRTEYSTVVRVVDS